MGYPTVRDAELPQRFELPRSKERDAVLSALPLSSFTNVVDLQSASGYLADEIHRRLGERCTVWCVEPSKPHREQLAAVHRRVDNELTDIRSLRDGSQDAVLGLAALHHSESVSATIDECARVLAPGGILSLCDVEEGSPQALFLEEVVGRYGAGPHEGNYHQRGEIPELLSRSGFDDVDEQRLDVSWTFDSEQDLAWFLRDFFALKLDVSEVLRRADEVLGIRGGGSEVVVPWSLLYWRGRLRQSAIVSEFATQHQSG